MPPKISLFFSHKNEKILNKLKNAERGKEENSVSIQVLEFKFEKVFVDKLGILKSSLTEGLELHIRRFEVKMFIFVALVNLNLLLAKKSQTKPLYFILSIR